MHFSQSTYFQKFMFVEKLRNRAALTKIYVYFFIFLKLLLYIRKCDKIM